MTAIQTVNLTKKYKGKTAVDALNLEINQGELFALLGVNGAGKSTTIKMLSCLAHPTSGDASLLGNSIITEPMKVKEKIPEALLVFVTPPTVAELEKRLKGRGTETDQVIADRLARAGEEAKGMDQYDYILVNDDVEECVDHLHDIIVSEHSRASRNIDFIEDIQRQTKAFQK